LSELRAASLGHRRGPATRKTKTVISADRKHMSRIGRKKGKN
jgi:general stress protein YciG